MNILKQQIFNNRATKLLTLEQMTSIIDTRHAHWGFFMISQRKIEITCCVYHKRPNFKCYFRMFVVKFD